MRIAAVSEFKAKLAKYLRLVKSGEDVEIRERGVPVAILSSAKPSSALEITPPRKDPVQLAKIPFSAKLKPGIDVVDVLLEDRRKR